MNPLGWILGLLLSTVSILVWEHAPTWLIVTIAALSIFLVLAYVGAYLFFMLKNPDALRSERFTLSKMQIEKSQLGDTSHGFNEIDTSLHSPAALTAHDGTE
jgi:uncharacterized protein YacL